MEYYHIDFALQAKEHLNGIYNYIKSELSSPRCSKENCYFN